jgi:CubicO group peptidase (beta-lactamase class C family)
MLAVISGKLIEQDKLRWDTKFFDIFPELQAEANKEYHAITLEDLFLCKAGIQPFTSGDEKYPVFDAFDGNMRDQFIQWLLQQPPGSDKTADHKFQHLYSNAGYTLIAAMLEKVSGRSWEALMQQTLTTDLGFSVVFGWPNSYHTSQPWGHGNFSYDPLTQTEKIFNELRAFPPEDSYKLNKLIAPAGDLSMKPLDFVKYTQLHLQGLTGISNYLSSEMYQTIHFGHQGFSLGVGNNSIEGKRVSGFDGSAGTFYCRSILIPEDDFAFTIMINSGAQKAVDWITFKIAKRYYHWWWKFWI